MKKKTKLLLLLVVSMMMIFPFHTIMGIPATITAEAAGKIEMSHKTASVHKGESLTLQLKNVPAKGKVTWSTSNSKIVSITKKSGSKATIKGIKKGTAIISATYNKKKYVCKITVNDPAKLTITSSNLKILETKKITLSNAIGGRKVTWKCSNTKIATIKANKNTVTVTGKAAGSVKITATYGGKNYTCTIKVLSISINKKNTELTVGASETLQLSNAVAGKATWSTSNKSIVSVTPNKNKDKATIKAQKTGVATITAKIGGKSYTCKVTVKKNNSNAGKIPSCVAQQTVYATGVNGGPRASGNDMYVLALPECFIYIKNLDRNAKVSDIKSSNPKIKAYKRTDTDAIEVTRAMNTEGTNFVGMSSVISFKISQNGKTYKLSCKINIKQKKSPFISFKVGSQEIGQYFNGYMYVQGINFEGEQKILVKMSSDYVLDSLSAFIVDNGEGKEIKIKNGSSVDVNKCMEISVSYHTKRRPANYIESESELSPLHGCNILRLRDILR